MEAIYVHLMQHVGIQRAVIDATAKMVSKEMGTFVPVGILFSLVYVTK